ncbi:unnamed protein product [Scytosiphon promiscuus]
MSKRLSCLQRNPYELCCVPPLTTQHGKNRAPHILQLNPPGDLPLIFLPPSCSEKNAALSPTMTHGNIGAWGKQEGDEISAGDIVCEVETDKATVDFDAQDDSFMAKHLVEAGTQDIPVGTPIFVTVEDAESVAAFKDFKPEAVAEEVEQEAEAPAAAASTPEPVAEKEEPAPAPAPEPAPVAPVAESAPAPPAPATAPPAEETRAPKGSPALVFKRDWGSGVQGSPLAHRLSAEQKKYVERFGSTLQQPLEP